VSLPPRLVQAIVEALQRSDEDGYAPREDDGKVCPSCGEAHSVHDTDKQRQSHALRAVARKITAAKKRLELLDQLYASIAVPIEERKGDQVIREMLLMDQLDHLED
jgi:hypothetical protein